MTLKAYLQLRYLLDYTMQLLQILHGWCHLNFLIKLLYLQGLLMQSICHCPHEMDTVQL
ncbi:hypothetical protein GW17_00041808 [Ensete ventricosum]|nr:hypothetical protein GW17_00041808 [Ensete ventricosum]RZR83915.1 hypothetical protein BHM03_00010641 [Ensete ventricosum]